jgi:hypothetical protein
MNECGHMNELWSHERVCVQSQAKVHDVLRKAKAAASAMDRKAGDVTSAAAFAQDDLSQRLAGTVAALKGKVSEMEACLEVQFLP